MNLAKMLAATVKPLSAYEPACQKRQRTVQKASSTVNANVAKHMKSITAYRNVWRGAEWLTTAQIEQRLGRGRSCCLPTLTKWAADGILERRKIIGANGRWNRRLGVEWRWL